MSLQIACPRLGIEPCSTEEFAKKLNAIEEFPELGRSPGISHMEPTQNENRFDLAILSCMMALGGRVKVTPLYGGFLSMQSELGAVALRQNKATGKIEILEFEEKNGETAR